MDQLKKHAVKEVLKVICVAIVLLAIGAIIERGARTVIALIL